MEVYVPAINKSYDVYIPIESKFHEVVTLVAAVISEVSEGHFKRVNTEVLCDRATGAILNINLTTRELRLENGAKLMLI